MRLQSNNNFPTRPKSELDGRIWTFQERLFSRRIVTVTAEGIFWDCCFHNAHNRRPLGLRGDLSPGFRDSDERRIKRMLYSPSPDAAPSDLYFLWRRILQDYTQRQWTYTSDRLIALQGAADRIGDVLQDTCCLGVWKHDALRSLIWFCETRSSEAYLPSKGDYDLEAPSWSWASVSWPVPCRLWHPFRRKADRNLEFTTPLADIVSSRAFELSPGILNRFPVFNTPIAIKGPLASVPLLWLDRAGCQVILDPRPYETFPGSQVGQSRGPMIQANDWKRLLRNGDSDPKVLVLPFLVGGYSRTMQAQYCFILAPANGIQAAGSSFRRLGLFVMDNTLKPICLEDPGTCTDENCEVRRRTVLFRKCCGKSQTIWLR
jgi:hypothetical protein